MMNMMDVISQNGLSFSPMVSFMPWMALVFPLVLADLVLKGFGMWRAARMGMKSWFIALLLINSLCILPTIFLVMTNEEYEKLKHRSSK